MVEVKGQLQKKRLNNLEMDYMAYHVESPATLTRHHIVEKRNAGPNKKYNYAILTRKAHDYLNILEIYQNNLYMQWQLYFMYMNKSPYFTQAHLDMILSLKQMSDENLLFVDHRKELNNYDLMGYKILSNLIDSDNIYINEFPGMKKGLSLTRQGLSYLKYLKNNEKAIYNLYINYLNEMINHIYLNSFEQLTRINGLKTITEEVSLNINIEHKLIKKYGEVIYDEKNTLKNMCNN